MNLLYILCMCGSQKNFYIKINLPFDFGFPWTFWSMWSFGLSPCSHFKGSVMGCYLKRWCGYSTLHDPTENASNEARVGIPTEDASNEARMGIKPPVFHKLVPCQADFDQKWPSVQAAMTLPVLEMASGPSLHPGHSLWHSIRIAFGSSHTLLATLPPHTMETSVMFFIMSEVFYAP